MKVVSDVDLGCFFDTAANVMTTNQIKYHPISCEFHDLLETHATTRKLVPIRFRDGEGTEQLRSAIVTDVFARDGAEYLSMSTGETLRLDQLLEVDDAKLADYCSDYCSY